MRLLLLLPQFADDIIELNMCVLLMECSLVVGPCMSLQVLARKKVLMARG